SMMLLDRERELIERVMGCKVTNRYGCEEVGLIASECEEHRGLHINVDDVFLEVVDDEGRPVKPGIPGKILVTDLANYGMPLIRYRIEDVGILSDRQCPCGRGLPLMHSIMGRVADFLKRADGT